MPTKSLIESTLARFKSLYAGEGFIIYGYFGSYARGDNTETSDVDVLMSTTDEFNRKYKGWGSFARMEEIRQEMEKKLGTKVDLANYRGMQTSTKYYIDKDLIRV